MYNHKPGTPISIPVVLSGANPLSAVTMAGSGNVQIDINDTQKTINGKVVIAGFMLTAVHT